MSNAPSAGGVSSAVPIEEVPAQLLQGGEVVILAIKPSVWYIVLVSWPVLATAVLLPLLMMVAMRTFNVAGQVLLGTASSLCTLAAILRIGLAIYQWTGRLYVLTNLRIMRIRGLAHMDVFDCPLIKIAKVLPSQMMIEKPLELGSLLFELRGETDQAAAAQEHSWNHIARLNEVYSIVSETIRRLK